MQADFGEKPVEEVKIDPDRYNKFLKRVGPFIINYLDESLERPNILRTFKVYFQITIPLSFSI